MRGGWFRIQAPRIREHGGDGKGGGTVFKVHQPTCGSQRKHSLLGGCPSVVGAFVGRLAKGRSPGVLEEAGGGSGPSDGRHELGAHGGRRTTASGA